MGLFGDFEGTNYQQWLDKIIADLKGKDFQETLVWNTKEGINIQPVYDSSSLAANKSFNLVPSQNKLDWVIQEKILITSVEEANRIAILALKGGAESLLFVGAISSQNEMDTLLKDIQSDIISLNFYSPNPKKIAELLNFNVHSISYASIGEFESNGNWQRSKEDDINCLATITSDSAIAKTIAIRCNYADVNITQELAFSLAQAVEYFNLLTDKGLTPQLIANKIHFTFGVGSNYFFEIAKLRVARLLWKTILTAYKVEEDTNMSIHSETTINESENEDYNFLRNTTEAMSAVLGGCDSLTVIANDDGVLPKDSKLRIARNIQHILKQEAFFNKVSNPADGSYYIEQLTDEIAKKAWEIFQGIEKQGGYLTSIKNGLIANGK